MDDDARVLRLSTAIFCAPLFGVMVCAVGAGMLIACSTAEFCKPGMIGYSAVTGLGLGLIVGVPTMLLAGLPTHVWLVWTGRTSLFAYTVSGVGPGILAAIVFTSFLQPSLELLAHLVLAAMGAVTGVVSSSLFWFIRRPDIPTIRIPTPAPAR